MTNKERVFRLSLRYLCSLTDTHTYQKQFSGLFLNKFEYTVVKLIVLHKSIRCVFQYQKYIMAHQREGHWKNDKFFADSLLSCTTATFF